MTPYILPAELLNLPTGVQWSTIPRAGATAAEQAAAQYQLCMTASDWVDGECHQSLRATTDADIYHIQGSRAAIAPGGELEVQPYRWPVLSVSLAELRASNANDTDYSTIASADISLLSNAGPAELAAGAGTSVVRISGSWYGIQRDALTLRLTYVNGWPNSALSAGVTVGQTSLPISDVVGWAVGTQAQIIDGANTERLTVTAVVANGDGTGSLTVPALGYVHVVGVMVTAMPGRIRTAAGFYVAHLALFRGTQAIAPPSIRGGAPRMTSVSGQDFLQLAKDNLVPFRRII